MYGLIAALVGSGLGALGTLLFLSNRFGRGKASNHLSNELLSLSLILGGGAILLASVTLDNPPEDELPLSASRFDPNELLEQAPTASAKALDDYFKNSEHLQDLEPLPLLPHKRILLVSWGTPSDTDMATTEQVADYTRLLNQLMQKQVLEYSRKAQISTYTLSRDEYQQFRSAPLALSEWCGDNGDIDLVIALGVGPAYVNGGYAMWREPVYEMLDCSTNQATRRNGKITERPGDRFPYYLALQSDINDLLTEFVADR